MASPFGKAASPFADSSHGLSKVGKETKDPFQQPADQKSFGFGKFSPATDTERQSKNPFQQSKLVNVGSSTSQAKQGGSFFAHASNSPFSAGISSSPFGNWDQKQENPFLQQSTPSGSEFLAWGKSQTIAHGSNILGNASTLPLSTGQASPFAFIGKKHSEKNPFQQSKVFGGEGLAARNSQTTTGIPISGHTSPSPFSFGKSSPSNYFKPKNPFERSTFLAGKSLAPELSQAMAGSSSFSFGKSSPFANSGNVHKPEVANPFQNPTPQGNRSTWRQKEIGSSKIGGGSPFFTTAAAFGQPAMPAFASGSGSQSAGLSPSLRPSGDTYTKEWRFSREGSSLIPSSSYGGLSSVENGECMEEDTLISLSATPSYESTSPEELRWKDYQAKQAVASQMAFNAIPSSPFIVSNMCNGDAPPSNSQFVTPNPADHSTHVCKFCNNGASVPVSSAGLNSGSFEGNPNSPFSSVVPFSGLNNQSQVVPQPPFGSSSLALGLSPAVPSMSTMSCPVQTSSGVEAHSEKASCLEWPQNSLQAPILSTPSPLPTIISSPSADSEDRNILLQRELAWSAAENSYPVTSGTFKFSNTESGSLVRHGISSLPDAGKYSHPRTISLLTSKKVFQKTVIRMQSRRQGSLKKDGPRVSFLDDYSDPDASYVAHRNPKEFLLHTRPDNSAV